MRISKMNECSNNKCSIAVNCNECEKHNEHQLQQAHRAAEESAKDAHRRGWEQAKREAVDHLRYQHNLVVGEASLDYLATLEQCWNTIASMEYKEPTND